MSEEGKEGTRPEFEEVGAPEGAAPGQPPGGDIPPPGASKKKSRTIIVVAASVLVLLGAGTLAFFTVPAFHNLLHPHPADNAAKAAQGAKYTCGMHPFIISDKPGKCPICGMTLTKIGDPLTEAAAGSAAQGAAAGKGERKLLFYRHPMNPGVTSPVPAKDEMGMDYVPVTRTKSEVKGAP
jgi:Cu(I)/Ag(I) efflux system membrane fusion protein/cobalt-zinc-cadmium efflux system membrane fusion protein